MTTEEKIMAVGEILKRMESGEIEMNRFLYEALSDVLADYEGWLEMMTSGTREDDIPDDDDYVIDSMEY